MVFVSSNSNLLSSTILLFHSLLKPFKWHHPLVSSLPQEYMHLIGIPVPILLGLNKDTAYVENLKLTTSYESCMFILLDGEGDGQLQGV